MAFSGSITFIRGARRKRVPLFRVESLAALSAFASNVTTYSATGLHRCVVSEGDDFLNTDPQATPYVGYYAVFRFVKTTPDVGENPRREFHLPDPLPGVFELAGEKQILQVKASVGEDMAAWYSVVTGSTYTFTRGWLWKG